jgi:hypothetical protein
MRSNDAPPPARAPFHSWGRLLRGKKELGADAVAVDLAGRAVGAADDEHTRLSPRRIGNQEGREDVVRALDLLDGSRRESKACRARAEADGDVRSAQCSRVANLDLEGRVAVRRQRIYREAHVRNGKDLVGRGQWGDPTDDGVRTEEVLRTQAPEQGGVARLSRVRRLSCVRRSGRMGCGPGIRRFSGAAGEAC